MTILVFAGVFAALNPATPATPAEYLALSTGSFVILVFGSTPSTGPVVDLVAQFEGFLGAFLIALFVFTLPRSVHR